MNSTILLKEKDMRFSFKKIWVNTRTAWIPAGSVLWANLHGDIDIWKTNLAGEVYTLDFN